MMIKCRNLGLFGGTFNPVHIGHLRLAEDICEEFRLDKVVFIPTNIPPHKKMTGDVAPEHRICMVEAAIKHNSRFVCDDIELKRGGISYTIETVNYVYENYGFEKKPFFILGSDLLDEISTWKDIDLLAGKVHFIVMMRGGGSRIGGLSGLNGMDTVKNRDLQDRDLQGRDLQDHKFLKKYSCLVYEKRNLEITSSEIRKRIKLGKSIRYLVTEEVLSYIEKNNLYM
jgi:nicotinate-nucleotide adenylyltransferase